MPSRAGKAQREGVDVGNWTDYEGGYELLLAAVVRQARDDAQCGDGRARHWLRTEGIHWLEYLGLDPERARALLGSCIT